MSKKLVAYFSATGNTRELAEKLASLTGADLHEIRPKIPYTASDLDWNDERSRSTLEMKSKISRPEVENRVSDMEKYDVIYVAFPIWWYVAPRIINTFLEQYDLSGKVVVPVATSGGSGMGNTNKELSPSCMGAILKEGGVFSVISGGEDLKIWAEDTISL